MTIRRRTFIHAGAVALGMPAAAVHAQSGAGAALDWPTKPVKFVVPFAPGGGADVATRMLADQLRTVWEQRPRTARDFRTGRVAQPALMVRRGAFHSRRGAIHGVTPAEAGVQPEVFPRAVEVEVSQDGFRPSPD